MGASVATLHQAWGVVPEMEEALYVEMSQL